MNIHEFREFLAYARSQGISFTRPLNRVMIERFRAARQTGRCRLPVSAPGARKGCVQ